MSRCRLAAIALLGITLATSATAHQGIFEYWKAGARRGRSKSSLPAPRSRAQESNQPGWERSDRPAAPWTDAWFSDSTLMRRHLATMTGSLTVPMVGQGFPLPKGGGFVCSRIEGGVEPADGGLTCIIECIGPELGGRRWNQFYASEADPEPTLDHVRWLVLAPREAPAERWRAFYLALVDSLSGAMGQPSWTGTDKAEATWRNDDYTTTVRFYGGPARVDSLEMESVSARFAASDRHEQTP